MVLRVESTIAHPEYERPQCGFDIALLKLPSYAAVELSSVPVPMLAEPDTDLIFGTWVYALGWGMDEHGNLPPVLQLATTLQVVNNALCPGVRHMKDTMLCAFSRKQSACGGDSGGPLLIPDYVGTDVEAGHPRADLVVGIISFGPECTGEATGSGYTKVSYFRSWIESVMVRETVGRRAATLGCPG
ncbi:unnamed protein product [Ostreobium quekettii]|uniref:Peptidase S1 domain-containing protein n=1 Tax=Ostreobium quekettii TaxID=121088 RepID=A0A8S1J4U6_9CHLO|nr:unnamed protein product [Ostreobium quekettii]